MKYGLLLVSRRDHEPESYWARTERGLVVSCHTPNDINTPFRTDDINKAFHQMSLLTLKLKERANSFPPSDYYWIVEELQDITLTGDVSGSAAGPQVIGMVGTPSVGPSGIR